MAYKTTATSTRTVDPRSAVAYFGSMMLSHVTWVGVRTVSVIEGRKRRGVGSWFVQLRLALSSNWHPLSR